MVWAGGFALLFALGSWLPAIQFFARPADYLPLHMALESVSIAVSAMVFGLAWNLRNDERNGLTVQLGVAFLAIGLIDFAHTLSYQGMPDFVTPAGPEKAINFWLAARYIGALAFLAVGLWPLQRVSARMAGVGFAVAALLAVLLWRVGLYHADALPRTFVPGSGLTAFKIGAEYVLVVLHLLAAFLIARRAHAEREDDLCWLAAASVTLALAELFFTFYASVTDIFNLLGHVYKTAAYLMVYRALFVTGVRGPQRQLAAERARVSELEQRWKFAIEGSAQGVWDWNAATNKVYFSPRWKSMLGYTEAEVGDGLSEWESRVHPEDLAAAHTALQHHFDGDAPYYENRHRMRAKDGSWHWILDRGMVVARDEMGKPSRVVGTHTDITELVTAQQALEESESRYRSIIHAMLEGMMVLDASGRIVACNPAVEAMFGVPARELMRQSPTEATWISIREDGSLMVPEDRPGHLALSTGESQRNVVVGIVQPHGTLVWLSTNAEPLFHAGATRPHAVVVAFTDITERKQHDEALRQSENRFRAIFDAAPAGVLMATTSGQIVQVNPAMGRLFGYAPGEMARMTVMDITDPADHVMTRDYFTELSGGTRRSIQLDKRYRRKDGSIFWGSLLMTTLTNETGGVIALLAIVEDIDERYRARLAVEESNRKLEASLAELARHDHELSLVNRLYQVLQSCETEAQLFGELPNLLGPLFDDRPGCVAIPDAAGGFAVVCSWGTPSSGAPQPTRLQAGDAEIVHGKPLAVQGRLLGVLCAGDNQDQIADMVAEAIKLSLANLRLRDMLEHEASHDPLTGLFNRRSLDQMLPREMARAMRGGDSLALAMVDADYFKKFNDTYGHEAGDKLLVELARVFGERLRKSDFAARYGGEEFVLVLPDTDLEGALDVLRDVAAEIARVRVAGAGVTVSMGVAMAPTHGDSVEDLLRKADAAVYQAKALGRNRIEVAAL